MSEIIRELFDYHKWVIAFVAGLAVTIGATQIIGSGVLFDTPAVSNALAEGAKLGVVSALATRAALVLVENVFRSDKNHLPPPPTE